MEMKNISNRKRVLVIGNGFDLDLGLKTSYKDFACSGYLKKLNSFAYHDNLIACLICQSSTNWFDIEECIADYVKQKEMANDFRYAEEDKMFYPFFKENFADFIDQGFLEAYYKDIKQSLANQIIKEQINISIFDKIYSFNCFDYSLNGLASYGKIGDIYVDYVHNKGGKFILGICEEDCTTEEYSFLIKKNQDYEETNIVNDLDSANDIVIFGHSLNRIDKEYFQNLFLHSYWGKNITIITKNIKSIQQIEANILMMGGSLDTIKKHCNLTYIETEKFDNHEKTEIDKIENLLSSLKCYNHYPLIKI